MEKKKISGKVIGAAVAVVLVVCVAVIFFVMHFTKKEDSYRSIQIYELKGTTTIEREGIGAIEAIENLYLESGDRILVADDSSARLKLDDDKYILVEENSILSIVAEGNSEDSKTTIYLEQGAITNEIQNKLNENSTYDVTTPNSVMAVRGTVFRVEVYFDENGEVYTKVTTAEGSVASSLILPDGTRLEEVLIIEGGKETIIHMNTETTEYFIEPRDIDYSQMPLEVLEFLKEIAEDGTELSGISLTEIEQLIEELRSEDEIEEEIEELSEDETEEEREEDSEDETDEDGEEELTEELNGKLPEQDKEDTETSSEEPAPQQTSQSQNVKTYTVTFIYNGSVFGKQTVKEGEQAAVPKLSPAESGAWDFDFSKAITGDVTVYWK